VIPCNLMTNQIKIFETRNSIKGNLILKSFEDYEVENEVETEELKIKEDPDEESVRVRSKISVVSLEKLIAENSSSSHDNRDEQSMNSDVPSNPTRVLSPVFIPVCKSEAEVVFPPGNQMCLDQLNTEYKVEPNDDDGDYYADVQMQMEESEMSNDSFNNSAFSQFFDASKNASSDDLSNATIRYATGKSISYFDDKIPAGWKRVKTQRKSKQVKCKNHNICQQFH
jgi:hypothetical protein